VTPKYLLPCPCGQKTPITLSQSGQSIRCQCGRMLDIPTMLEIRRLERAELEAATEPRRTWGFRQRLVLLGTVTTLIAAFLAVGLFLKRPVLRTPAPQQIETAAQNLTLTQSFAVWEALRAGLDSVPEQIRQEYTKRLATYRLWLLVTAVIACLGMICAASSLLVPRREQPRRRLRE
jgi:hypothetical protein